MLQVHTQDVEDPAAKQLKKTRTSQFRVQTPEIIRGNVINFQSYNPTTAGQRSIYAEGTITNVYLIGNQLRAEAARDSQ